MKLLRNNYKKAVSVLLSAALIMALFTIVPFTANAADTTEISGIYTVPENGYTFNNRVVCDGDVTIVLTEGATLNIPKGINLKDGASLTINGKGNLTINGVDDNNAGIGGDEDESLSSLTVNGGNINVKGGENAAGIGGGKNGFVGKVTINGGVVSADGGIGGAGIGTGDLVEIKGDQNDDDGVYISGGEVTAIGGEDGAGIGEGKINEDTEMILYDSAFAVDISGGTVRANANNNIVYSQTQTAGKPSIGGESVTISITGGDVNAGVGGLASNDAVILSWKKISDKYYFDGIFTSVELQKELIEQGTENSYPPDTYEEDTDSHPLEHKTLIPPQDIFLENVSYIDENGDAQTVDCAVKADETTTVFDTGWYALSGDEYSYTLDNENRIVCNGDVNLILTDGYKLKTNQGITVNEGSSLTVYGQSGCTGELVCGTLNSTLERAGIGGDDGKNSGNITLVGGKITANGGYDAAGIGGGNGGSGTVTVKCSEQYRAEITANGGYGAAGIGGGRNSFGNVDIYGGKVTATGGQRGAGIGGGHDKHDNLNLHSTINIYGGSVYANVIKDGAGIGSGEGKGGVGIVNISGGYIEARGLYMSGDGGAGIGGGFYGTGIVTISGGEIHAAGGEYGAGIGSGDRDQNGTSSVTISGGMVLSTGGQNGAGIGGGFKSTCTVTISGGFVYATRGSNAYGIGNGKNVLSGTSEISLSWTNQDDSIYSTSYGGNVTLEKAFKDQNETVHTPGAVSNNSEIDGKTLTPYEAYTVTWENYDGNVLETDLVESGANPSYDGETPEKPGSDSVRYIFKGWTDGTASYAASDTLPAVTGDITYTAEFTGTEYAAQTEPYIDENGAYILGVKEHYVIDGKNYAVNADGSVGNELPSVELSYFEFGLINNDTEYRINYYTGPTENLSELVIPKTFKGKKITVLGNTVTSSGDENCRVVPQRTPGFTLVLNENITKITDLSFYAVQVTGVKGDTSSLNSIGKAAFSWANSGGGYSLDIKLDYKGQIYMGDMVFNYMKVNALISHDTTFSKTSLEQQSITYSFSDNHKYNNPVWTWADDYSEATAKFTCTDSRCRHEETVDATVTSETKDGIITYTATAQMYDNTYTDVKTAYADGIGAELVGHSISLDGDIGVNFYMELSPEIANSDSAYMQFNIPDTSEEYQSQTVYVNAKDGEDRAVAKTAYVSYTGKTYYVFKCRVAAKDMETPITAKLIDGDKESDPYYYSVKQYGDYLLTHTDEDPAFADAADLVSKLLVYGENAKWYFGKTDEAPDEIKIEIPEYTRTLYEENLPEGVTFGGATLSLKSETTLSLYFNTTQAIELSCEDENITYEIQNDSSEYVIRIRGIAAYDLNKDFTVKVNGKEVVIYSPLTYCYKAQDSTNPKLANTVRALYNYWVEAKKYFDKINS